MKGLATPLTDPQAEILRAVMRYIENRGRAPSHRELVKTTHYRSPRSVANRVAELRKQGYLLPNVKQQSWGFVPSNKAWALRPIGRELSDWKPAAFVADAGGGFGVYDPAAYRKFFPKSD